MTIMEFVEWARDAYPGDRCIYHVGELAIDRQHSKKRGRDVDLIAQHAIELADEGKAILTQQRNAGTPGWEYWIRIATPARKAASNRVGSAGMVRPGSEPKVGQWEGGQ